NAIGDDDRSQPADSESRIPNAGDAIGDDDRSQPAESESRIPNAGDRQPFNYTRDDQFAFLVAIAIRNRHLTISNLVGKRTQLSTINLKAADNQKQPNQIGHGLLHH
ncbi:hypothetical protein N8843_09105, partial [Verrucomicrobia bacterium]|nr:hypothetical protein [Verrucomicrobiota bacterium]MDA7628781.1 hypothetical protein [Verrucomicrobiota bacterium]